MRIRIFDLQSGDRLAEDIFNSYGLHVLSKGTVLQDRDLSRLFQHHIDYVEIEQRSSAAFLESVPEPNEDDAPAFRASEELLASFEDAVAGFEQLFRQAMEEGQVNESDVNESFRPLMNNFREERDVVSLLLMLNNQDDYTYQHSVQVGMLCYYLAKWLGWSEAATQMAGKAGFLHDIGKCRIPGDILNKPGKLTDEEFAEIRNHPSYGYEILRASGFEDEVAEAARQHHERTDGHGYPSGLSGSQIHPIAKVVAVADVYSAMISTRVYKEKKDQLSVLKELYRMGFQELDPLMVQTFVFHMLPNLIGKKVKLTNGESGTVVLNHPTDPFHPLVQVAKDRFLDLSVEPDLEIVQVSLS
ncbi:HD-GYP domain-containing protein [Cohnella zeiphila]|uniref:HD-GYP domain-containing protein n=1 Tax=Cohnella zeiphila TaxID=2761120 RepID=A0A7X0SNZ1_9BACL|nr:HD-GYP domain-containing protein [Cohnella zeiphila]MBB6733502.1 HD-GYP domain-containing protein [Cohnella zeiphila]